MKCRGYKPAGKVISFERRPVEVSLAKELRRRVSAPVWAVRRLRLINQEPVMLENFVMPVQRLPRLERFDLEKRSVYEIVEAEYGVRVSRARQSLKPTVATAYEAEMLQIAQGPPLMLKTRFACDPHEQPVEYGRDLYRGDRFRFTTEIAPLEL